jgi:hypothetical protein
MAIAVLPPMLLLAGCTGTRSTASSGAAASGGASPDIVQVPGAGAAATWGSGPYGLVLLHDVDHASRDWEPQGATFANDGMTVVAPEGTDAVSLRAAITWLQSSRGIARVAVLAAGTTSDSVSTLAASDATLIDQAILISPAAESAWPWDFPTMFAAGQDAPDAGIAERMAGAAPGQWNELLLVPSGSSGQTLLVQGASGASELMTEILRRLDERR